MKPRLPKLKQSEIIQLEDLILVGIAGKAGSGKDTVAGFIYETYDNVFSEHFADPLKAAASIAWGVPEESFHDQEKKTEVLEFWNDYDPLNVPRKIAQYFGTEMFRNLVGPNFWVRRLEGRLTNQLLLPNEGAYVKGNCVLIPDVRFQNEVDWLYSNGGALIHLTRPETSDIVGIQNHQSESGITNFVGKAGDRYYEVINNSTLDSLKETTLGIFQSILNFHPLNTQSTN
jgi:hypothetical protein